MEKPSAQVVAELAPHGKLRAGINMANMLLVSGTKPSGEPFGVAPDMAAEIAAALGMPVAYVPFPMPAELAEAADKDQWDIGLIAHEPQRAEKIAFSAAYSEIEATYMVRGDSKITSVAEVDRKGMRIALLGGSAYDLYLSRHIVHAELVRFKTHESVFEHFVSDGFEVMAGIRPALIANIQKLPGARMLPDRFTAVQQAVGTARRNTAGAAFLNQFVAQAKSSGLVARLIERHKAVGLTVAA